MTNKEKDDYIAEHIMGWKRVETVDYDMNCDGWGRELRYSRPDPRPIKGLDDEWEGSEKLGSAGFSRLRVSRGSVGGQGSGWFCPTTNEAQARLVRDYITHGEQSPEEIVEDILSHGKLQPVSGR